MKAKDIFCGHIEPWKHILSSRKVENKTLLQKIQLSQKLLISQVRIADYSGNQMHSLDFDGDNLHCDLQIAAHGFAGCQQSQVTHIKFMQ